MLLSQFNYRTRRQARTESSTRAANRKGERMDIRGATISYEKWMRNCTTVVEAHLRLKHERMRDDAFLFFRGTYYRWIQLWPEVCKDLRPAPKVLAVGDLHVGSFGTWRDVEG